MRLPSSCFAAWLLSTIFFAVDAAQPAKSVHWPSFRGTHASGVAEGFRTPTRWNVPKNEGVRWKTRIPGLGHSSPIVWGDRIFVTTASREGDAELKVGLYGDIGSVNESMAHKWLVIGIDKATGKILWEKVAREGVPKIKRHPKASHANSTPATDGRNVVAFFGSEGLHCFDMKGELRWTKDLGVLDSGFFRVPSAQWGFASSPVIHDGRVIVQCDVQTNSFLAAFDIRDGKELWRAARTDVPTWSTPAVVEHGGRTQVVVNGYKHSGGYDFASGSEIWRLVGGGDIPVPTPIVAHGLIFLTSAHGPMAPIYAIRLNAKGDISLKDGASTNEFIPWSVSRRGNYMQTPLVHGEHLYACNDAGVVTCYNAVTGEKLFSERLGSGGSGFTASGVAADGKLYFTSETGVVHVLKAGPANEVIAQNDLGETCMATPAISEGVLFFRTRNHLVAVGEAAR